MVNEPSAFRVNEPIRHGLNSAVPAHATALSSGNPTSGFSADEPHSMVTGLPCMAARSSSVAQRGRTKWP